MSIGNSQPGLPYISSDQMREVDRLMVEEYHICLVQMMENAGRKPGVPGQAPLSEW